MQRRGEAHPQSVTRQVRREDQTKQPQTYKIQSSISYMMVLFFFLSVISVTSYKQVTKESKTIYVSFPPECADKKYTLNLTLGIHGLCVFILGLRVYDFY